MDFTHSDTQEYTLTHSLVHINTPSTHALHSLPLVPLHSLSPSLTHSSEIHTPLPLRSLHPSLGSLPNSHNHNSPPLHSLPPSLIPVTHSPFLFGPSVPHSLSLFLSLTTTTPFPPSIPSSLPHSSHSHLTSLFSPSVSTSTNFLPHSHHHSLLPSASTRSSSLTTTPSQQHTHSTDSQPSLHPFSP